MKTFEVTLYVKSTTNKVGAIKLLREVVPGLMLKEAKDFVDNHWMHGESVTLKLNSVQLGQLSYELFVRGNEPELAYRVVKIEEVKTTLKYKDFSNYNPLSLTM